MIRDRALPHAAGARRTTALRWALVLLLGLGLAGALLLWGVSRLGSWLMVSDPLAPARAIAVLNGHYPFRAMEAAALYGQGWAPEVWLTLGDAPAAEAAVERLGLSVIWEETYNREVLERLDVPPSAIRVLAPRVRNTVAEVRAIAGELTRLGGERVILVTSKPPSRRVHATWQALVGDRPRAIVRYAMEDPYEPAGWWRRTGDALAVSREIFGLLNVWAGFPIQVDARKEPPGLERARR